MCFLYLDVIVFLLILTVFKAESWPNDADLLINNNVFKFSHMNQCKSNEFYNLDYFTCLPCDENDSNLQQSSNKFNCQCKPTYVTIALYDTAKRRPICVQTCANTKNQSDSLQNKDVAEEAPDFNDPKKCLQALIYPDVTKIGCKFKYVNFTNRLPAQPDSFKHIRITTNNPNFEENCTICNLKYNSQYQDFCIYITLLKPYLKYDAFSTTNGQFSDLKFVAFFCLSLHNASACNQLANLCVISFYSFDKNSPCSPFLLSQASETLLTYAHLDEHLKLIRPFMFYKKGKQSKMMITEPIENATAYSLPSSDRRRLERNLLHFFATVYSIDGSMQRWGPFRPSHVNFCRPHNHGYNHFSTMDKSEEFRFGIQYTEKCQMSLENIIDLTKIYGNNQFFSIFLNFTTVKNVEHRFLQHVPVLIENLSRENQNVDVEEWQLVKRFQLFESHERFNFGSRRPPSYEDEHKLMLYRTIRYVDKFEIHYNIKEGNRISIPIIKLHYRIIEFNANSSLDHDVYTFHFLVRCTNDTAISGTNDFNILFLVLLLVALIASCLRTYNFRRRHQQQEATANVELCDVSCITEFLLSLVSNMANMFLAYLLLDITYKSLMYLTQRSILIILPLAKDSGASLDIAIYAAVILKLIYLSIHFWRLGHIEIFFVDWERPKTCDANHFNTKNNLETSSVCSSVRTLVPENNVSAWRIFYIANEWIMLSGQQQTSVFIQCILSLICFTLIDRNSDISHDFTLQLFALAASYVAVFLVQFFLRQFLLNRIVGHPLQKLVDICSLANISIVAFSESLFGFYIHGRSPHGFADTDVSTMLLQLQRQSQNMCGRRGLLSDSDQQTYIILPPTNLRMYCENLLIPLQKSCNISQAHLKKEASNNEAHLEKTSIAYSSVNRFFCAFIDHAIRDMDYIIREKTFVEKLLKVELDNYLTKNKGTFYIDKNFAFSQLFLYGNSMDIFVIEVLLLLSFYKMTNSAAASVVLICSLNKLFQKIFCYWVRQNLATKALIDKRFLK